MPDPRPSGITRLAATVEQLRDEVRRAQAAADGRGVIELATGILVERLHCGPAEAAAQLVTLAEEAGLGQLELAADIINQAARDHLTEVTRDFLERAIGGGARRPGGAAEGSPSADGVPVTAAGPTPAVRMRTAESGALAADDTQAVATSLLEHALAPLGVCAVAIWAAAPDASLTLAGSAGVSPAEAARWHYVPPGVATPARRALAERQIVRLASLAEAGLPSIGHRELPAAGGRVALPAGAGGRVIGVLEICWPDAIEPHTRQIERQFEALAELCARTLEIRPAAVPAEPAAAAGDPAFTELTDLADGLYDPALVLRPHFNGDGHVADFRIHHVNPRFADPAGRPRGAVDGCLLLEAYPLAAEDGGLFEKVERVHATGEPFRAQRMALTALVDQVPLTVVADISISRQGSSVLLIWRIRDEMARLASLLQHAQRLGRIGGFEENLLTGEITWAGQLYDLHGLPSTAAPIPISSLAAHAHPDDDTAIGRFLRTVLHHQRPGSTAFRLRRTDGIVRHIRVIAEPVLAGDGRVLAVRGAYQDISAQHWTEVALAATRDRLAHTERQAAEHNRLALQLQRAIMPPSRAPIDASGLRVGVRYRPAEDEHLVGGDWYDAVVLPDGHVLLCVGDVAGHGIQAATDMVVLRNALRGLATTGTGPAQLLAWLNLVANHLTDHVTATTLCALYDPGTRTLRWARAGHPVPVLVRRGEAATLPQITGLLLGALPEAEYEEGVLELDPGDTLLLYTDGLIERRDRTLQDSLNGLLATIEGSESDVEALLDHLLTHSNADTDDDTCVIAVRLP
ncbi:SpoIIE family protein phosphatase [Spirillospora sp. NPDC047279]|uniref:SpoIIE family protein phosphatase n=1 Tax=Spirillospora sp. NPDC047279 TaxID=3155478 RepID=UPI0033FAF64C